MAVGCTYKESITAATVYANSFTKHVDPWRKPTFILRTYREKEAVRNNAPQKHDVANVASSAPFMSKQRELIIDESLPSASHPSSSIYTSSGFRSSKSKIEKQNCTIKPHSKNLTVSQNYTQNNYLNDTGYVTGS